MLSTFLRSTACPSNGSAGEPWPAGPSVPSADSTAAGRRNQRGLPADPFARPSAVGRTFWVRGAVFRVLLNPMVSQCLLAIALSQ
jgi:hypothetical protein